MDLNDTRWYEKNLAGALTKEQIIKREKPAAGFYRGKNREGRYLPFYYWYDDDGYLECLMDGQEVQEKKALNCWLFVRENPISEDIYNSVVQGNPWPDVDPVVAAARLVSGNQPPEETLADDLSKQIEDAATGAGQYSVVTSDEMAAKAQTLRSHLLQLHRDADKKREEEKAPFWEEVTKINEKWMPVVKKAKEYADKIRASLSAWETKKIKDQAAIQAAAQTTAKSIEEATGSAPWVPDIPKTTSIKGGSGRAASVKPRRVATAVTNLEALVNCLKGRPEFEGLLLGLAQKILDEDNDVLGIAIETRADVR